MVLGRSPRACPGTAQALCRSSAQQGFIAMIEFLQQVLNGLAIGSVYTLVALGLTVVFGILGIAHFAHGSLAMFGGYLTFVFSTWPCRSARSWAC
jgi:ABC-type branched-subunit amino acid transport system permease subunit